MYIFLFFKIIYFQINMNSWTVGSSHILGDNPNFKLSVKRLENKKILKNLMLNILNSK